MMKNEINKEGGRKRKKKNRKKKRKERKREKKERKIIDIYHDA